KRIRALPGVLTARQAAIVDARILEETDGAKKTEALKTLFEASPDDFELGTAVMNRSPPRARLPVLKRMPPLRAGPPLVLELREVNAGMALDGQQVDQRLAELARRATDLGARWELARARMLQAQKIPIAETKRWKEALAGFGEAERINTEMGEL